MSDEQTQAIQELLAGIYIQQLRIYDVLMAMLVLENRDRANALEQIHTDGKVLAPDPALKIDN